MTRRTFAFLGVVVVVLCAVVWAAGEFGPQAAQPVQGDQLGPERDEDLAAYRERAAATLEGGDDEMPRFAMVSFREPLSAADAAQVVDSVRPSPWRVNAVIPVSARAIAVSEPTAADRDHGGRAAVFQRGLDTASREFGEPIPGVLEKPEPRIAAVTVWDRLEVLQALAARDRVIAVEAAPEGAVWGNIALRPPPASSAYAPSGENSPTLADKNAAHRRF